MNLRGSFSLWRIERAFWSIFLAGFIGFGLAAMLRPRIVIRSASTSAYSSTDAMLRQALGVYSASEPVVALLSHLPATRPLVLVVNRRDNDSILAALTLSYLAWPRLLYVSYIEPDEIPQSMTSMRRVPLGGVFFYSLQPPQLPGTRSLGTKLIFVPSV